MIDGQETESTARRYIVIGALLVLGLGLGAAGGFVFGHARGMAANAKKAADAQALAAEAEGKAQRAAVESAAAKADQTSLRSQMQAVTAERDQLQKSLRAATDQSDAKVQALFDWAERALREGDSMAASQFLREYMADPTRPEFAKAKRLLDQLELVTSDEAAQSRLKRLCEDDLNSLEDSSATSDKRAHIVTGVYGDLDRAALVSLGRESLIRNLPAERKRRERESFKSILAKLEDEAVAPELFLTPDARKVRENFAREFTPTASSAIVRAFGHGAVDGKPSPGYRNSDARRQLDYYQQKRKVLRHAVELLVTGTWPPDYRGKEIRQQQIGRAFRLTELAVVKSNLPDFDFGKFSKAEQRDIVDVLSLFGDVWIFEGLPYGISGNEALGRMKR